jgi:hypothetical protein
MKPPTIGVSVDPEQEAGSRNSERRRHEVHHPAVDDWPHGEQSEAQHRYAGDEDRRVPDEGDAHDDQRRQRQSCQDDRSAAS